MKPSVYLNDILTKSAILGLLALCSSIAQTSIIYYGGAKLMLLLPLVVLTLFGVYCYLLYRFTRNYADLVMSERAEMPYFTYGNGLSYIVLVSMLVGVISGLGGYMFLHYVVGYEEYISRTITLTQEMLNQAQLPASMMSTYEQMFEMLESQPEPSFLSSIFSSVWSNFLSGTLLGLIIAIFTKRAPKVFDNNKSENE